MPKTDKLTDLMLGKRKVKGWKREIVSFLIFGVLITGIVTLSIKLFSKECEIDKEGDEDGEGEQNNNCSDGWNNLDKKGKILYGTSLVILLILFCYFIFYTKGLIGILDLFSR